MDYIEKTMNLARSSNCQDDRNFLQAVEEVLVSIQPLIDENPTYINHNIIERMIYPNKEIRFRIEWLNDNNITEVNNGYRIQFNNALGPYKGGVRFHPSVRPDILRAEIIPISLSALFPGRYSISSSRFVPSAT